MDKLEIMSDKRKHALRRVAISMVLFSLLAIGCKEDTVKEYYDSGELRKELTLKNGIPEGTVKEYHRNGQLKSEAFMKEGKLNGEKRVYYESGALEWSAEYVDGEEHGIFRQFSDNGRMVSEAQFANGLQHGITTVYRKDGKVEFVENYLNGLTHGVSKTFYPNGTRSFFALSENDITMYYEDYDSLGVLIEKFRAHVITIAHDTLRAGNEFHAKIEIYGPLNLGHQIEVCLFKNPSPKDAVYKTCTIDANGKGEYSEVVKEAGNYLFFLKNYEEPKSRLPFKVEKVLVTP